MQETAIPPVLRSLLLNITREKKREDGLRQAEKMLLTWIISDRDIFDKVAAVYKTSRILLTHCFLVWQRKIYEQYQTGSISPAAIIADYAAIR